MKPLNQTSATALLERIDHAANGELRSLAIINPTTMQLRLSVQDKNRGYDWIDVIFEVSGISNARLLQDKQLALVDMQEGITVLFEGSRAGVGVGRYTSLASLADATLYMIGSGVKLAEADFTAE